MPLLRYGRHDPRCPLSTKASIPVNATRGGPAATLRFVRPPTPGGGRHAQAGRALEVQEAKKSVDLVACRGVPPTVLVQLSHERSATCGLAAAFRLRV